MEVKFNKYGTGRVSIEIVGKPNEFKNPDMLIAANRALAAKIGNFNTSNIDALFTDVEIVESKDSREAK